MDKYLTKQEVLDLIKQQFQQNYAAGNPRIPPHQHNGVDNLQINAANILNLPTATAIPGGNNTNIQFNDNGVFNGSDNFTWDNTNNILDIEGKLQSQSNFEINVLGGSTLIIQTESPQPGSSGMLTLKTDDAQTDGVDFTGTSGPLNVITGSGFGSAGDINITTGNSITSGKGGDINLSANRGSDSNPNGAISLNTIGATNTSTTGVISLIVQDASGTNLDGGTVVLSPGNQTGSGNPGLTFILAGNLAFRTVDVGAGDGVIAIANATTNPTTTPTGGGILYVSAGALKYKGSSGTVTPIAPA